MRAGLPGFALAAFGLAGRSDRINLAPAPARRRMRRMYPCGSSSTPVSVRKRHGGRAGFCGSGGGSAGELGLGKGEFRWAGDAALCAILHLALHGLPRGSRLGALHRLGCGQAAFARRQKEKGAPDQRSEICQLARYRPVRIPAQENRRAKPAKAEAG